MRYEPIIRNTFDVVSVHGSEFLCKCPYHNDSGRPNLYANADKGVFLCHACGAKGRLGDDDLPPDWKGLLDRLSPDTAALPAPTTYANAWLDQFDYPTPYWGSRGFSEATIRRFQLGYDPLRDHGIIPVRNERYKLVGAIRRDFTWTKGCGRPKYMYPKGFPLSRVLFGSWLLGKGHRKVAIVEGSLDTIACWNARVPALGLLGANLTDKQHQLLHHLGVEHVVLMLDNDRGGEDGREHFLEKVTGMGVSVAEYRPYWGVKDPCDLTPQRLRKMFHSAARVTMRIT